MGLMVVCFSAGDEEWDDANEQNVLEASEQDNETAPIKRKCYFIFFLLMYLYHTIFLQLLSIMPDNLF